MFEEANYSMESRGDETKVEEFSGKVKTRTAASVFLLPHLLVGGAYAPSPGL